jgi:DNA-directed RNA polymerase subunit omega
MDATCQTETRSPVIIGQDDQGFDTNIDTMTEEELLRGLESLPPAETGGSRNR